MWKKNTLFRCLTKTRSSILSNNVFRPYLMHSLIFCRFFFHFFFFFILLNNYYAFCAWKKKTNKTNWLFWQVKLNKYLCLNTIFRKMYTNIYCPTSFYFFWFEDLSTTCSLCHPKCLYISYHLFWIFRYESPS